MRVLLASIVLLAGCQKTDPLYCGKHMNDPACGGDGGVPGDGVSGNGLVIGGNVTGLSGAGLVLQNNGGDDKNVSGIGPFAFPTPVPYGGAYAVTIKQQPSNPTQKCSVAMGSGTATADVTDVAVSCSTDTYSIGGSIIGDSNAGMVLQNNAGDDLSIAANQTTFTFGTKIASGGNYAVTIKTQPNGQTCAVVAGQGTVGTGNVTSIVINCSSNMYVVTGTVSGLNGTVTMLDTSTSPSGSDTVMVNTTSFAFSRLLVSGQTYAVTTMTNPAYPPVEQTCNVSNGTGTAPSVNTVAVSCTTNTYSIGGNVTGLSGTLVLVDNAVDQKSLTANGTYTFGTKIPSAGTYSVAVMTQPAGQTCSVANPSSTVTNANITNVNVTCTTNDPGILCGAAYCNPLTKVCCGVDTGSPSCKNSCSGPTMTCDDAADCALQGHTGTVCCASSNGGHNQFSGTSCTAQSSCNGNNVILCDTAAANNCPAGKTCSQWTSFPAYNICQ